MTENTQRLLRALLYLLRCEAAKPGGNPEAIINELEDMLNG